MNESLYRADVVIVGGGIAGIVAALELLEKDKSVLILDRDEEGKFGGLAKESFGGIFLVGTRQQRRGGIQDGPDLAFADWTATAHFGPDDEWPRRWAEGYVNECREEVGEWLQSKGIRFFPIVHWAERGLFQPGNSVPRFHMVWGLGHGLALRMIALLRSHRNADRCRVLFRHRVTELFAKGADGPGCAGVREETGARFEARGESLVIASGGMNGDLDRVRRQWPADLGRPPETILSGSHRYADGSLHDRIQGLGGNLTHLDKTWNYPSGLHHPQPDKPQHGLTMVPPKSALWVDYTGRRFGPVPLVTAYDTRFIIEEICKSERKYSWQIMNWKIARKEIAIQNSDFNPALRDKKFFQFLKLTLFGNPGLVRHFQDYCVDFVTAENLGELVDKMNALCGDDAVDESVLRRDIERYDANIDRGPKFFNDEQLRRIAHARRYRGDRVRTCKFQKILDPKAGPLIAVREFVIARKSLGGIQTDLDCRVLKPDGQVLSGVYAIGEAAGFGGGGVHGKGALEGTFLGGCVYTARRAARAIAG